MRHIASLLGIVTCIMPTVTAAQELDKDRLHALMSCRVLMQVAGSSGQFDTKQVVGIAVFGAKLKSKSELMMYAAKIPVEEQEKLWSHYENDVSALAGSNEAAFWGTYDQCFSNVYVVEALNSPGL